MDALRPRDDDDSGLDEDLVADLDGEVVDRLSAYGAGSPEPRPPVISRRDERPADDVPSWSGDPAEPPALTFRDADEKDVPVVEVRPEDAPNEEMPEKDEVRAVGDELVAEPPAAGILAEESEPEAVDDASAGTGPGTRRRPTFGRRRESAEPGSESRSDEAATPKAAKKDKRASDRRHDRKGKKIVGLKIGASQIAAAYVVNNGAPEVVELCREPLDAGIVVFGEIRDPEALGDALKTFFTRHKLPRRGVRLGISNNRVGVRIFEVDGVSDPDHLENAVRFRAEEVLPIPLDEAVLDYAILDESVLEDGTPRKRILLVVAYREAVERYLQACARAGLTVAGIDHEAFALLRSLEVPVVRDQDKGALVAAAIGHDRTTIAVSTGLQCEFARVLDWGGWSLNVAIARELHRAPSEVEQIKRQLSFAGESPVDGLAPEQLAKARHGMSRALEAFARDLVASLQFYQAQPGALGIGEIVLTGGTAHMDGLPDALGQIVGVPIRLGDPFKRLKVGPKVEHHGERGSLAIAIGLGIED